MSLLVSIQTIVKTTLPPRAGRYVITFDDNLGITEIYEHSSSPADGFRLVPTSIIDEAIARELLHPRDEGYWKTFSPSTPLKDLDSEGKDRLSFFMRRYLVLDLPEGTYGMYGRFTLSIRALGSNSRRSSSPFRLDGEITPIHANGSVTFTVQAP